MFRHTDSQVADTNGPSNRDRPTARGALLPSSPDSEPALHGRNARIAWANATVCSRHAVSEMKVDRAPTQQPGLYLVVLGGRTPHTHVELHDVRWVVGTCIDDTIPELKRQWFGSRKGLHLDSYVRLDCVDGYAVQLKRQGSTNPDPSTPPSQPQKLWFVNMGGYDASALLELHAIGCVVAPHAQAAKNRAKHRWLKGTLQQHKDDLHMLDQLGGVDNCLPIEELQGWEVKLTPTPDQPSCSFKPDWFGYRPI